MNLFEFTGLKDIIHQDRKKRHTPYHSGFRLINGNEIKIHTTGFGVVLIDPLVRHGVFKVAAEFKNGISDFLSCIIEINTAYKVLVIKGCSRICNKPSIDKLNIGDNHTASFVVSDMKKYIT